MTPDNSLQSNDQLPEDEIEDMGLNVIKKLDTAQKQLFVRQEIIDKNNKQSHKSNLTMLVKCKQILDSQLVTLKEKAKAADEDDGVEEMDINNSDQEEE